jgi:hypothetical protein
LNKKKRHHYIPIFYLNFFKTEDGFVCIYDRKKKEFRRQKPINTAVVGKYYQLSDNFEEKIDIEENLALVETLTKPIIDKLLQRQKINIEEKKTLTFFIALMKVRVPRFEKVLDIIYSKQIIASINEAFNTDASIGNLLTNYEAETGDKIEIEPEEFRKILRGLTIVEGERDTKLNILAPAAMEISKRIYNMTWTMLFCEKECSFITSDNPFVVVEPTEDIALPRDASRLLFQFSKIIFPLASNACLVLEDLNRNSMFINTSRNVVREINIITAKNCERFVISRNEALLRNIVRKAQITGERID